MNLYMHKVSDVQIGMMYCSTSGDSHTNICCHVDHIYYYYYYYYYYYNFVTI